MTIRRRSSLSSPLLITEEDIDDEDEDEEEDEEEDEDEGTTRVIK